MGTTAIKSPPHLAYTLCQWCLFPLLMFGTPTAAWWLIDNGGDFETVIYFSILFMGLVVFLFERLMPYRKEWNNNDADITNDVISGAIAYGLMPALLKPLFVVLLAGAAGWLATTYGSDLWPTHWPLWAQLMLGLLAIDAGRYWGHRLAHEIPALWRFHAIHHSPNRLWFFNALRQHPVDKVLFLFAEMLFPVLLGANEEIFGYLLIMTACNGFFQHTNVDVKLGPLYYIFNAVDLHRWHHSVRVEQSNNNYGNNLIVYDLLFGTYYRPANEQVDRIGLINPNYPKNYLGQLLAPFRKGNLDKEVGRTQ